MEGKADVLGSTAIWLVSLEERRSRMNVKERDELLIRIDERQKAIYEMNINQEKHLSALNSKVADNVLKIAFHTVKISNIEKVITDGVPLRFTRKQYTAVGISALTILSTLAITIGKLTGWW